MEFGYKYDPLAKIDRVTIEWRDMHGNLVSPKITPSEVSDEHL
jgi:hypothetical protein